MKNCVSVMTPVLLAMAFLAPVTDSYGQANAAATKAGKADKKFIVVAGRPLSASEMEEVRATEAQDFKTMADSLNVSTKRKALQWKTSETITIRDTSKAGKTMSYTYTISDSLPQGKLSNQEIIVADRPLSGRKSSRISRKGPLVISGNEPAIWYGKTRDPFAFDPTDPTIIFYEKKDVGKGNERITIVRKKKETN